MLHHRIITGGVGVAYKIQYSPETVKQYPQIKKAPKVHMGKWLSLILVVVAALWLRLNGIPDFLIPGDPDTTKAATTMLIEEIRNGSSVNDAVTVFCKEILYAADL